MDKKTVVKFNVVAIVCIIIFCFAITPITFQNDTYYTIKIGEHILKNGLDMQDHFSWHENLPYTYPHWAYDIFVFFIYNICGFTGIYISTIIFSSILGLCIYFVSTKYNKSYLISFITTILIMYLIRDYIAARAQLVTFILFVLTIFCIERFIETKLKRFAFVLLLISLIIANIHVAVWPFFFVLYIPYIIEYIVALIIFRKKEGKEKEFFKVKIIKRPNVKWLFVVILISILTGIITPIGNVPYTYLYNTIQGNTMQYILEHLPMVLYNNIEIMIVMLSVTIFLVFADIKLELKDILMFGGLTCLSFMSKRQVSILLIIGGIIIIKLIYQFLKKFNKQDILEMDILEVFTNFFGIIVTIIMILLLSISIYYPKINSKYIDESNYPVDASKWIKENLEIENIKIFNEYGNGSYLLFNDIPVFIDSRADLYTPEFNKIVNSDGSVWSRDIFSDFVNVSNLRLHYDKIFDKYEITHVVIRKTTKLNLFISKDNNYNKIYSDGFFIIYEKRLNL